MGVDDDGHSHLQTRGVLLLSGPHLDQPDKVQVRGSTLFVFRHQGSTLGLVVMLTDTLLWHDSDEELDNRSGREQFVELDSLDTEKALLLTDDDDPL